MRNGQLGQVHILHPYGESSPRQPIPTNLGSSSEVLDLINRTKFHVDRLMGFGLAGTQISRTSTGK
jgi:hypothetical protein